MREKEPKGGITLTPYRSARAYLSHNGDQDCPELVIRYWEGDESFFQVSLPCDGNGRPMGEYTVLRRLSNKKCVGVPEAQREIIVDLYESLGRCGSEIKLSREQITELKNAKFII